MGLEHLYEQKFIFFSLKNVRVFNKKNNSLPSLRVVHEVLEVLDQLGDRCSTGGVTTPSLERKKKVRAVSQKYEQS